MFKFHSTLLLVCISMLLSVQALAVDLFTISQPKSSRLIQDSSLQSNTQQFNATLNSEALEVSEVMINLPNKQLRAQKLADAGTENKKIEPYGFLDQSGAVFLHSKNGVLEEVVIHDDQAKKVFKGFPQANGELNFKEVGIDTYICENFEAETAQSDLTPDEISYYQSLDNLTLEKVSTLESRPGASKVLFIDYSGGTLTGTSWNTNGSAINYNDYSYDSDPTTFSQIDLQSMYAGWAQVAEDFGQFGINVTTDASVYESVSHRNKSRIIATSTKWRGRLIGGVAYLDSFGNRDDNFYSVGWAFNSAFGSLGRAGSHEAGHQMGLRHDGFGTNTEYYRGHGNYGPIMGSAPKSFIHWDRGLYNGANQTQNDIAIINEKLDLVTDDHGDNNATATTLSTGDINVVGLIAPRNSGTDTDTFKFTLSSRQNPQIIVRGLFQQENNHTLNVIPYSWDFGTTNLSALITLRDASGNIISQKQPTNIPQNNSFLFSEMLNAGTYYLSIVNQSYDSNPNTGFTEYGNSGFYQISMRIDGDQRPDLRIDSMSANSANLLTTDTLTLTTNIVNSGDAPSSATTLNYYISDYSSVSTSSNLLGSSPIEALAAESSTLSSLSIDPPAKRDTYFILACLETIAEEFITANNCAEVIQIKVDTPPADLIVIEPTSEYWAPLEPSSPFRFSFTVRNQGGTESEKTTARYYLSTSSNFSTSASELGSNRIFSVPANSTRTAYLDITLPSTKGTYYAGVCVDIFEDEDDSTNNCSGAMKINVSRPADLVVESPELSKTTLITREGFTMSATVKNQGDRPVSYFRYTVYRSSNPIITTSNPSIAVGLSQTPLNGDESRLIVTNPLAPSTEGTYYIGMCVQTNDTESDRVNNCSEGILITTLAQSDLLIESVNLSQSSLNASEEFTMSVEIKNRGAGNADSTTLRYYLSTDAYITNDDTEMASSALATINSNSIVSASETFSAPLTAGTYYLGACVDSVSNETVINNNCTYTGEYISVTEPIAPDLTPDTISASNNSASPSSAITISAMVNNIGNATSPATTLRYYVSSDEDFSATGTQLTTSAIPSLVNTARSQQSETVTSPSTAGIHYFGVCVDTVQDEINLANNCSIAVEVTVSEEDDYEPDDNSSSANSIKNNQTQLHSIHVPYDEDWLKFTLNADVQNLVIQTSVAEEPNMDTVLVLYDASLNQIAVNDNSNDSTFSKIELDSLAAGDYFFKVTGSDPLAFSPSYNVKLSYNGVETEEFDYFNYLMTTIIPTLTPEPPAPNN